MELGLHQFQQCGQQKGVVVEIGVEVSVPVLGGRQQTSAIPHRPANEIHCALCRSQPLATLENTRCMGHAFDHQRVPTGQYLVVASGTDAFFACGKELLAHRRQERDFFDAQIAGDLGVPMAVFEIRRTIEAPTPCGQRRFLCCEELLHFAAIPNVVLAFFAFRVGVERRVVAAIVRLHFTHYPCRSFFGDAGVERIAGLRPGIGA